MLNDGQEDRTSHGGEHEECGEAGVVLEEIGELEVVEGDQHERDDGDEDDEDEGVQECALELLRGGVGGILEVDEVGSSADRSGGRWGGEGVCWGEGVD